MSDTSGAAGNSNSGAEAFNPALFLGPDPDGQNSVIDDAVAKAFGEFSGTEQEQSTTDTSTGTDEEGQQQEQQTEEQQQQEEQQTQEQVADFATVFEARYQRKPTNAELDAMFQLTEWYAGLSPEHIQTIDRALSQPQYQQQQPQYQQQQFQQQQPQPQPQPQENTSTTDELAKLAEDDPALKPVVEHMRRMEENLFRMSQSSLEQQQQRIVSDMISGAQKFQGDYGVNEQEMNALQGAVLQSGIWPGIVQQAQGNTTQAMQDALSYFYWQTPVFRDREIAKRIEELDAAKKQNDSRKSRAAAVTGTGGNGASRTSPPKQVTNDNRWGQVADELREVMSNGQSN